MAPRKVKNSWEVGRIYKRKNGTHRKDVVKYKCTYIGDSNVVLLCLNNSQEYFTGKHYFSDYLLHEDEPDGKVLMSESSFYDECGNTTLSIVNEKDGLFFRHDVQDDISGTSGTTLVKPQLEKLKDIITKKLEFL